ncbi:MAG TPA: YtxH domain-containing protein [Verrucomicrobiae bacterium]|nr:YtxH domain-containing protein [Verrucomicrobiae bacterium]
MSTRKNDEIVALLAFFAGAAVGAGITFLVTPRAGREVREKLGEVTDDALQKVKDGAREARFKMSRKTPEDKFRYDGGDCWI